MQTQNATLAVFERARLQPKAPAFVVAGSSISYRRAVDLIVHFARRMHALGISRQSLVGLATNDVATATVAVLAIALLGGRWAPVLRGSLTDFPGTTHTLATGSAAEVPGRIAIDRNWVDAPPSSSAELRFPGYADPDNIWMIANSSGTTGSPKYMPISYRTLWRRLANPELQDGAAPIDCMLFPPTSYVGVKINIGNLVQGGTNVAPAPWDQLLAAGVNRVTSSPSQVSAQIFQQVATPVRRIRSLKVTGAKVTEQFVETALRYFEELHVLYGSTEIGTATVSRLTDPSQFDGAAGEPYEGVEVEVVDHELRAVPSGSEGIVRVRNEWSVPGYIAEPELTAEHFRDGWFYPGDLGVISATGMLYITGRITEVLNAGGNKFNATDVDEVIQLHPDVADGFCFLERNDHGIDMLSAIVALRPGAERQGLRSLSELANGRLGRRRVPRRVYIVDAVPRNENGKPMRAQAAVLSAGMTPMDL